MKRTIYLVLTMFILIFAGCSDSTDSGGSSDAPPAGALEYFELKTSIADNHPDSYAQSVKYTVEYSANDLTFVGFFLGSPQLPWKNKGDHWEFSITEGSETFTVKLWPESDSYTLEWWVSGTDDMGNPYSGMILEINQSKDKKSGYMKLWDLDEDPAFLNVYIQWTFNTAGDFNGTITTYDAPSVADQVMAILLKTNGTGNYTITESSTLVESALWNLDGSGSLTYHDPVSPSTYTWGANPATKTGSSAKVAMERISDLLSKISDKKLRK